MLFLSSQQRILASVCVLAIVFAEDSQTSSRHIRRKREVILVDEQSNTFPGNRDRILTKGTSDDTKLFGDIEYEVGYQPDSFSMSMNMYTIPSPSKAPLTPVITATNYPVPTSLPTSFPTSSLTPFLPSTATPLAPLSCSQFTKDQYLLSLLTAVTNVSLLMDPTTPQGAALAWFTNKDTTDVCTVNVVQRYTLATLAFSMGGDGWKNRTGWLTGNQECEWIKVTCIDGAVSGLNLSK